MKRAPNLKFLPKEKFTEAIIFAGTDAYAHAKGWEEGLGKQIAEDTTPPIYLGPKQLAELDHLQIIDDGRRSARVYLAGNIEPIMINAIGEKLARAGVQDAKLYKGISIWKRCLMRLRVKRSWRSATLSAVTSSWITLLACVPAPTTSPNLVSTRCTPINTWAVVWWTPMPSRFWSLLVPDSTCEGLRPLSALCGVQ